VYAPEESQIQASCLVQAFARAALRAGANIYPHQGISHLLTHGTKVTGICTTQGTLQLHLFGGAFDSSRRMAQLIRARLYEIEEWPPLVPNTQRLNGQ
jgi:glycine/D-amino acid oxidase-like deaminating enzyme